MGAWALTLFSCDFDLDLIEEINDQAGLHELEKAAGAKNHSNASAAAQRQADHMRIRRRTDEGDNNDGTTITTFPPAAHVCDDETKYSLYAKLCSHPERVRQFMDDGVLRRMMDQYSCELTEANEYWKSHPYGPGYPLILLGCCAMTLGAELRQKDRDIMQAHCRSVSLMRDAIKQVEEALDADTGYVNGIPWDFMTKPFGTATNKEEDLAFPGTVMINCVAPDHGFNEDEMQQFRRICLPTIISGGPPDKPITPDQLTKTMTNLNFDPFEAIRKEPAKSQEAAGWARYFPHGMCGFCGRREGRDGQALLVCSKCKGKQYCSSFCQKMAWKHHKKMCCAPRS